MFQAGETEARAALCLARRSGKEAAGGQGAGGEPVPHRSSPGPPQLSSQALAFMPPPLSIQSLDTEWGCQSASPPPLHAHVSCHPHCTHSQPALLPPPR